MVQPTSGSPVGMEKEFSEFEQVHSRAHSRHKETRKSCYSRLELSHNLQGTCEAKGLSGNLLWHHPTRRGNSLKSTYLGKKGETTGHVLPLVLPCFIGLPGLCNIWLFTRMIKGQTRHHSCTTHDGKDSTATTAHVRAFWMGKILV